MTRKLRLMIPGPTPVPPEVSEAMARPMIGHRSKDFAAVIERLTGKLRQVLQTKNEVFILTGSGTGGLEAAVANTVNPGDRVLALVGGKFGERFRDLAGIYGAEVIELAFEWGRSYDLEQVRARLTADPEIKAVLATQNETSTGVTNDIAALAALVREHRAILCVDAVSGLGGIELKTDEWGVDIVVTASQKALMTPPGLAVISVSEKAWARVAQCRSPRYYFSLEAARKSLAKWNTAYTPAVSLFFGLEAALDLMLAEGMENVYARHRLLGRAARAGVKALGLELLPVEEAVCSPVVTAVKAPAGINADDLRKLLLDRYNVLFAGGQAQLKGKVFRIAHMGYADRLDVLAALAALEMGLAALGIPVTLGSGVRAAQEVFVAEEQKE
ncbi:MAG: alanine--glyoxylate aminotransferase family protein [Bacillota bacterium]|nr:alanine--glyoxylate aminotransferase family protein [Bacillota bacterium]